jgi:hypothetical protein
MKLCKDCMYVMSYGSNITSNNAMCKKTEIIEICPVTGDKITVKINWCKDERNISGWFGKGCGPDAKYFESRENKTDEMHSTL